MPVLAVKCSQGGAVLLSMIIGFLAQISHVVLMGILIDKNKATAQPIVPVDLSVPYGSLIVSKDTNKRLGKSIYRRVRSSHMLLQCQGTWL